MGELNLQDENTINLVWQKGLVEEGYNEDLYRKDAAGAWISRAAYGDKDYPWVGNRPYIQKYRLGLRTRDLTYWQRSNRG